MVKKGDVPTEVVIWLIVAALAILVGVVLLFVFSGKFPGLTGGALP